MKFRLVDSILAYKAKQSIRGIKAVSFEEYQLKQAFSETPALPESLLMESFFQLSSWLIMLSSDFTKTGLVVQISRSEFHSPLKPGEHLTLNIHVRDYQTDSIEFDGQADSGDRSIASCTGCTARLVAIDEYYSPSDMRVLFSEIYRPHRNTKG
jgi:3-hydroxyacyl-[acyl-carrier-protein] dehydratase